MFEQFFMICIIILYKFLYCFSYNRLFMFLLNVKRAQLALQQCWALQMDRQHRKKSVDAQWWLRHHMSFLIDNLQYYLQVWYLYMSGQP